MAVYIKLVLWEENMNSHKIEMGAVLEVKQVVFRHELMADYINSNDKEPSWDGFIYIYKSEHFKVEEIEYKVPVQIKGKNDESKLNRKSITFPVKFKHLRNYYRDGGILYVVVIITDDGEKKAIFYNSLTTVKLKDLLKGTEQKGPEKTKNIVLQRLNKSYSDNLYKLLKQLGRDREKQGSGNGEIIKKAISFDDMDKVDYIQVTSCFASNEIELMKEIMAGDVSLYGHRADLDMLLPFDYSHQKELSFKQIIEVKKTIGIGGMNFYDSYLVELNAGQNEKPIIILSDNLKIDFAKGKVHFTPIGTIDSLVRDIGFINGLKNGKQFVINGKDAIDISDVNIPKSMNDKMLTIKEIDSAFKVIGIKCEKRVEAFTDENWNGIGALLRIYHGEIRPNNEEPNTWYCWKWDNQIVPILLHITENGDVDVINWFYTKKYVLFLDSDLNVQLPRFAVFKRNILIQLYDIPDEVWMSEIERIHYSEGNFEAVLSCFIEILSAYDMTGKETYYKVADALIDKLLQVKKDDAYAIINKMQLIKRKGELAEDCINRLEIIESECKEPMIICAINILLENKRKVRQIMKELSEEERSELKSFPIYNLFERKELP